jgi:hypothetical protein
MLMLHLVKHQANLMGDIMIYTRQPSDGEIRKNEQQKQSIMFTPARDFLLETPWRIIIPNPNVNSHSL